MLKQLRTWLENRKAKQRWAARKAGYAHAERLLQQGATPLALQAQYGNPLGRTGFDDGMAAAVEDFVRKGKVADDRVY